MVETRATRKKRTQTQQAPWKDLELGVWERIFSEVEGDDLRNARLTCSLFRKAASRVVKALHLGSTHENRAVPPKECYLMDEEMMLKEMDSLPGLFECVHHVNIVFVPARALWPSVVKKLACFTGLTSLRAMFLDGTLTLECADAIAGLSSLRTLVLHECYLSDNGSLEALQRLPHLQVLQVRRCQPHNLDMMASIAKLTGLTALDVSKPFCFKDVGYSTLASLSNLRSLHLGWSWKLGAGGEQISFLSSLRDLEQLAFTKCFVSDLDLEVVGQLTNLEELVICQCHNVTGTAFQHFGGLVKLKSLDLEGSNMITDEAVGYLSALTALTGLTLGSSRRLTTQATIKSLSRLSNLQSLAVPEQTFKEWPAVAAQEAMPQMQEYVVTASAGLRLPGQLENRLRRLLHLRTSDTVTYTVVKLLNWFQGGQF